MDKARTYMGDLMKKRNLLVTFATVLIGYTTSVYAATIPFSQELENELGKSKKVLKAVWSPSANSTDGSSTTNSGVHDLGVALPAKAIVTNSYMYIKTAVTDGGTNPRVSQVEFKCEDAANILASTNLVQFSAGTIVTAKQYGTSSTPAGVGIGLLDSINDICNVQAVVTLDDASAGRVLLYLEYVVAE